MTFADYFLLDWPPSRLAAHGILCLVGLWVVKKFRFGPESLMSERAKRDNRIGKMLIVGCGVVCIPLSIPVHLAVVDLLSLRGLPEIHILFLTRTLALAAFWCGVLIVVLQITGRFMAWWERRKLTKLSGHGG